MKKYLKSFKSKKSNSKTLFFYPQRAVKVRYKDWKVVITFMDYLRINTESYY